MSEAPPAETPAFAQDKYIRLQKGDKITYNNKFGQVVTMEAKSYVPDFRAFRKDEGKYQEFSIGNRSPRNPSADFDIYIEGETKPTYVSFTDLDYSDSVSVRKSDITQIVVKDNTQITYEDLGDYIRFNGLQGRSGTSPGDDKVWVTILLRSSRTSLKVRVGNLTLIGFEKSKLFPEGKDIALGSVTVKYITEDGNVLEDVKDVVRNVHVDTEYNTEKKDFEGYEFLKMDENSSESVGRVTEGEKQVIYVYKEIEEPTTPPVNPPIEEKPPTTPPVNPPTEEKPSTTPPVNPPTEEKPPTTPPVNPPTEPELPITPTPNVQKEENIVKTNDNDKKYKNRKSPNTSDENQEITYGLMIGALITSLLLMKKKANK